MASKLIYPFCMLHIEPIFLTELRTNLKKNAPFIQVILGPRQVGKTTGILQFLKTLQEPHFYFSADDLIAPAPFWIEEIWQSAASKNQDVYLVIDEIQKVKSWSSTVKKLWDQQQRLEKKHQIKLILLGSSSLEIQDGLSESLTGRFQLVRATHWGLTNSRKLAGLDLKQFITQGGYPGSYQLVSDSTMWEKYIRDSIIEPVIGRDLLQLARIHNPSLFRQAFHLLMSYPAQEISYTKLLGQLQNSGNTDLVKNYIELFEGAYLLKALQKYSHKAVLKRASSPKIIPLCGALISREVFQTKDGFSRAFEASVGAVLIHLDLDVFYWRDGNHEVDFVTVYNKRLIAIEVKSGKRKKSSGLEQFTKAHSSAHILFINEDNIEKFLLTPEKILETAI